MEYVILTLGLGAILAAWDVGRRFAFTLAAERAAEDVKALSARVEALEDLELSERLATIDTTLRTVKNTVESQLARTAAGRKWGA